METPPLAHCERCAAAIDRPAALIPGAALFALLVGDSPFRPRLCVDCAGLYNLYTIAFIVVAGVAAVVVAIVIW